MKLTQNIQSAKFIFGKLFAAYKINDMIHLLIVLIIAGVVLYLINLIPMDAVVKKIIYALAILFIVVWLLQEIGVVAYIK